MAIATLSVAVGVLSFTQKVSADTNGSNTENVSSVSVSTEKTQNTQNLVDRLPIRQGKRFSMFN